MSAKEFKHLRNDLMQVEAFIESLSSSRNVSLAYTSVQKGRMHAGNVLGYMGSGENPYLNSTNPTNNIIEPLHKDEGFPDLAINKGFADFSEIQKIKEIRRILAGIIEAVEKTNHDKLEKWSVPMTVMIYIYLKEAKNFLGEELGAIRNRQEKEVANA